jgi:S-adenosylhomocysteine hydrolase
MTTTMPRHWRLNSRIQRRLPLLDHLVREYRDARPLAGTTVLSIQHQLGNHWPQARALIDLGVRPDAMHWIDIPYTAHPSVRKELLKLNIPEPNLRKHDFRVLDAYAPYQHHRVQAVLWELLQNPPERLLVLDDGAYFLQAAAGFRRRLPHTAIVEQTTRGLIRVKDSRRLSKLACDFRVINVAESEPKKTLEPPFIGLAVCAALRARLERMRFELRPADACLVLGYGSIGRRVASWLEREFGHSRDQIYVSDPDDSQRAEAEGAGYPTWQPNDTDVRFRLVIGCSGRASFDASDYQSLVDGAVLASASSGTVELSRRDFIELADVPNNGIRLLNRGGLEGARLHSNLQFCLVDRKVTFINAGFPVNFSGRINCVPAHYIQPTPTMMVYGAIQAMAGEDTGLISLDDEFGRRLTRDFCSLLGDEAHLLEGACERRPN